MSAMSNLFLNQSSGRLPNGRLRGVRRDLGTVYFALKPEPDVIGQVVSAGNHFCARHELAGSVRPSVAASSASSSRNSAPDAYKQTLSVDCRMLRVSAARRRLLC
jgi:hypothetical protein